jgi:hypothetical protein
VKRIPVCVFLRHVVRRASTGGSLEARQEGNNPATIPTTVARVTAAKISSGLVAGMIVSVGDEDEPGPLDNFGPPPDILPPNKITTRKVLIQLQLLQLLR